MMIKVNNQFLLTLYVFVVCSCPQSSVNTIVHKAQHSLIYYHDLPVPSGLARPVVTTNFPTDSTSVLWWLYKLPHFETSQKLSTGTLLQTAGKWFSPSWLEKISWSAEREREREREETPFSADLSQTPGSAESQTYITLRTNETSQDRNLSCCSPQTSNYFIIQQLTFVKWPGESFICKTEIKSILNLVPLLKLTTIAFETCIAIVIHVFFIKQSMLKCR